MKPPFDHVTHFRVKELWKGMPVKITGITIWGSSKTLVITMIGNLPVNISKYIWYSICGCRSEGIMYKMGGSSKNSFQGLF